MKRETINIKSEDGKEYEFEKPEFDCLLEFIADGEWIYGWIEDDRKVI